MMAIFGVELRRCLARRLVRWLVAVAVVACAAMGVIVWATVASASDPQQFRYVEVWQPGRDSFLGMPAILLVLGGMIGGASLVGAEWRAGTFATLLTWEPARRRVALAKLLSPGLVAGVIAVVLQVVFCLALLPAAAGPGTTAGVDGDWLFSLLGAVLRFALLTALAATLSAALAMVGRNTSAALAAAFAYLVVFENIVRALKPWTLRFLLGFNGAIFGSGQNDTTQDFTRSTLAAGLTLLGYVAAAVIVAVALFRRRDVAGVS